MTGSLAAARDERGEVIGVAHLGGGMVEITARLPHLARTAQPGQFAQLRCGDGAEPLLRRPFSVAWTERDTASFVLAPVGAGTRLLAALRAGDHVDALGPLGHGFTTAPVGTRAVCVAGGLGCAPFPLLARALRARGVEVTVVNGAAHAALLYPADRFRRGDDAVDVVPITVDGSAGARGVVTTGLEERLRDADAVYCCGPNPMLAAVATLVEGLQPPPPIAEASLEAPMGCGFGTCLGCALPGVRNSGWLLCCRDGPVMTVDAVDWEALMRLPPAHVA